MFILPNGKTVLIDWGKARIAQSMLDIANLIELNSENWYVYLDTWQALNNSPMDLRQSELGYHWATIMVNTMYLPHATKFSTPELVMKMIKKVSTAERRIDALFSQNFRL